MTYTKFVIFSEPRSGSTFLSSRLNSHPNIRCFQELFDNSHDNKILDFRMEHLFGCSIEKATYLRNENPELFIRDIVFRNYDQTVSAVGFKFHYFHAQYFQSVLEHLRHDPFIKVLHVKRNNILDTYISLQKALQTQRWVNVKGHEDSESGNIRINIDHNACVSYFRMVENFWREYDLMFEHHEVLNLEYSKLTSGVMDDEIQDFLRVSRVKLFSPLKKHPFVRRSLAIINHDELKESFLQSKWVNFFDKE